MKLLHFSNIEGFDELYINKIFLSIFTIKELKKNLNCAFAVDENNIIINTKNHFFELLIIDHEVIISCNDNYNSNSLGTISKKTFLILLSQSEIQFPKQLEIDV